MCDTRPEQLWSADMTDVAWKNPGKVHGNLGLLCTEEQRFSGTQKEVQAARPCLVCSHTQLPLRTRNRQRREIGNLKPAGFLAVKRINSDLHPTSKPRSQGTMQGRHQVNCTIIFLVTSVPLQDWKCFIKMLFAFKNSLLISSLEHFPKWQNLL